MSGYASADYDKNKVIIDKVNEEVIVIAEGPPGSAFNTGIQGPQGIQGLLGLQGPSGAVSAQGIQGPQGPQGNQGIQGIPGSAANFGAQGTQGLQGSTGQGIQGPQGTQGIQGVQGSSGPQGTQGRTGIQGIQGSTGSIGPSGIGIQGPAGVSGSQGTQGLQGVQGFQGIQGVGGSQGIQGPIYGNEGFYAYFIDTTTQTNTIADTPREVLFNTIVSNRGITLTSGNRIYFANSGIYDVDITARFDRPTSGNDTVYLWLRKNGVDVDKTSTTITLVDNPARENISVSYLINASENDYYQVMWSSSNTSVRILSESNLTGPSRPDVSSVKISIKEVVHNIVGPQGIQGFTGESVQGFTGTQGLEGQQGVQGIDGEIGAQGIQGIQGFDGVQGSTGIQGSRGLQGIQGSSGSNGFQGTQGIQGFAGIDGAQGTQGADGIQGLDGAYAAQGIQGTIGQDGIQGTQGIQGSVGLQGIQGSQGLQGSDGIQGNAGIQGSVGLQGIQGSQGLQGSDGIQGNAGIQGSVGLQGIQGVQGVQGNEGIQGKEGVQGFGYSQLQGLQGIQGPAGPSGTGGGEGGTFYEISSIPPETPEIGDLWFDTNQRESIKYVAYQRNTKDVLDILDFDTEFLPNDLVVTEVVNNKSIGYLPITLSEPMTYNNSQYSTIYVHTLNFIGFDVPGNLTGFVNANDLNFDKIILADYYLHLTDFTKAYFKENSQEWVLRYEATDKIYQISYSYETHSIDFIITYDYNSSNYIEPFNTVDIGLWDSNSKIFDPGNVLDFNYVVFDFQNNISNGLNQYVGDWEQVSDNVPEITHGPNGYKTNIGINTSLQETINGYSNIAIGSESLLSNSNGKHNIAIGTNALKDSTDDNNIAIGHYSLQRLTNGWSNVTVGTWNLHRYQDYGSVALGHYVSPKLYYGDNNILIGNEVLRSAVRSEKNISIGGFSQTDATSSYVLGLAGYIQPGDGYTDGVYTNVELIPQNPSIVFNMNPYADITVENGKVTSVDIINGGLGVSGFLLTANIGPYTQQFAAAAGFINAQENISIGFATLENNKYGRYNTVIGNDSGNGIYQLSNSDTGSGNAILGYGAGHSNFGRVEDYNVFIGHGAGTQGSNKLHISNSVTETPLIYGEFDPTGGLQGIVHINGTLQATNFSGLIQGTQGADGLQGIQGLQGNIGLQGLDGAYAAQGIQGTQGPIATDTVRLASYITSRYSNATTSPTSIISHTIPANSINAGQTYRIKLFGYRVGNTSGQATYRVNISGVTALTLAHSASATANGLQLEAFITIMTTGTSGTVWVQGMTSYGTAWVASNNTTTASIDTTANSTIDVTLASSSTSNTYYITNAVIEKIG